MSVKLKEWLWHSSMWKWRTRGGGFELNEEKDERKQENEALDNKIENKIEC